MKIEYFHSGGKQYARVTGNKPDTGLRSVWHITWGDVAAFGVPLREHYYVPDDIQ